MLSPTLPQVTAHAVFWRKWSVRWPREGHFFCGNEIQKGISVVHPLQEELFAQMLVPF